MLFRNTLSARGLLALAVWLRGAAAIAEQAPDLGFEGDSLAGWELASTHCRFTFEHEKVHGLVFVDTTSRARPNGR